MVSTRPQKEYRRSNAGLMSPMAKPNKASKKSAPYSASAKKTMANKMLKGATVAASKASKSIYPSKPGMAAVAGKAIAKGAKGAKAGANVKSATKQQNKPELKKAQPYYDILDKKTKYSPNVRIGELPRKAKRK